MQHFQLPDKVCIRSLLEDSNFTPLKSLSSMVKFDTYIGKAEKAKDEHSDHGRPGEEAKREVDNEADSQGDGGQSGQLEFALPHQPHHQLLAFSVCRVVQLKKRSTHSD